MFLSGDHTTDGCHRSHCVSALDFLCVGAFLLCKWPGHPHNVVLSSQCDNGVVSSQCICTIFP